MTCLLLCLVLVIMNRQSRTSKNAAGVKLLNKCGTNGLDLSEIKDALHNFFGNRDCENDSDNDDNFSMSDSSDEQASSDNEVTMTVNQPLTLTSHDELMTAHEPLASTSSDEPMTENDIVIVDNNSKTIKPRTVHFILSYLRINMRKKNFIKFGCEYH